MITNMTAKGWIGWLGLLWLVSVGVGAQEKGVVAVLTEVRGRQVRMQVVGEEGLKAGDRLTVVSAVTGQSVAHLRLLRVRPPNAEAVITHAVGIVRVGDKVVLGELPLSPAEGEVPTFPEPLPPEPSVTVGRLDLPSALPTPRHLFAELNARRAELGGRRFRATERLLHLSPLWRWTFWYGRQTITLKGRDPRNRFDTASTHFGVRYLFQTDPTGEKGWGIFYERFRPETGFLQFVNGSATLAPPKAETFGVLYSRRHRRLTQHWGLGYSRARIPTARATTYAIAGGLDVPLGRQLAWQFNAAAFLERQTGVTTFRPTVFFTALTYTPVRWARLEISVGYAPKGFPVAGTPLTGVSSFLLHQPGGVVQEFSRRAAGFYTARLLLGTSF
jgi:hypothetical protein